ncbi:uncharacterized protein Z519_02035 [Cladophialophora bantiana CBS 173.52]|uniref:Enoyl reductase (ER) domain-containing protein n=1 Tax=Cladophialophora bantiana (strain ATCC 10958 / CBS 173.52 / CDC B-1940 / NIH 8579) TaxID=1442370 RepID=A0A0D2IIP8_CLAB1|nr:uncharacterized protein Z519_02035 [Cladophialophora bantiana CBS 173.52]KIW96644.1 hypothetical protein Z519_02035 [Cladophialophora bantiana CBS 173.52]
MAAPKNRAAWLRELNMTLEVGPAEMGKPGPDEVLIKNRAVAMNPVDWMMQYGAFPAGPLPRILGNDVAGDIVEVGEGVTQFAQGQRVLAHCIGLATNESKYGAFQEYAVVPTVGCCVIPDGMKYDNACVLPLAISTASIGLFHEERMGLMTPTDAMEKGHPEEAILVWGGSSSVGSAAIQLAVAATYKVVTTASPRNFDLCRKLGASEVFDHTSPGIVGELTAALQKWACRGAFDAIATRDTQLNVAQVLSQLGGGRMAVVLAPIKELPATVEARGIYAVSILQQDKALGKAIYGDFLPRALEQGLIKPAPPSDVIDHGVEHIQAAVDKLRAGVSGSKVVVTL